ncbi:hypothetical protein THAOC_02622 [Thalassiosira oceanica]|uniref:Uncharacterized protein n=1 Tax=Thalassiosira oceanica TaxID=159749 RepID=K0TQ93_THAOC|nr:hypothetical protein THAOC_02622 [Thalassiosira oceanica]|eukprot:EJK75647.1 hypothetical protein THAOC_02622 [Thalassiosira oceanica]
MITHLSVAAPVGLISDETHSNKVIVHDRTLAVVICGKVLQVGRRKWLTDGKTQVKAKRTNNIILYPVEPGKQIDDELAILYEDVDNTFSILKHEETFSDGGATWKSRGEWPTQRRQQPLLKMRGAELQLSRHPQSEGAEMKAQDDSLRIRRKSAWTGALRGIDRPSGGVFLPLVGLLHDTEP